jgi:UPF0755 protein
MKRPTVLNSCLLSLIVILCLSSILTAWLLFKLPADAERVYGPSTQNLDIVERAYLSARLLMQEDQLRKPADPLGGEQTFQVTLGETTGTISARLENNRLVPNAEALTNYLVYAGLDTSLQAGEYLLSPRMTPIEIAHALLDATPSEVTFTILAGWRIEEIAAALPTSGLDFSPELFLIGASHPQSISGLEKDLPVGASLEGFLFPDAYRLPRHIPVDGFIRTLVENFEIQVNDEIRQGFQLQGLDVYQAVILASIVEREAVVEDEMPMIASVYLNRLSIGMKLDADPTVQYALGYNNLQNTWWTNPLSLADLEIESPYNTYRYQGLPPGPIANPSLTALRAIAFPAQTPYYYFRSACDGSGRHTFAETFSEHKDNACGE